MDHFIDLLFSQLNSSVVILLALLVICFFLVYKVGHWSEMFSNHKERIGNVEAIRDIVIALNAKVDLIYQNTNPNPLVKAQSPISLTEAGREIVKQISAETIFKKHSKKLIGLVEAKSPKNAYDIQQSSFTVAKRELIDLLNEEELGAVKKVAFERGLLVEDLMTVFGILLRNRILEDKNIPIAEVDRHEKKEQGL